MAKKAPRGTRTVATPLTFRVDPKTRFAIEMLARYQRRTITSTMQFLLDKAMGEVLTDHYYEASASGRSKCTLSQLTEDVWSPYEADTLVNLAWIYKELLSYEERLIWSTIQDEPTFWTLKQGSEISLSRKEKVEIANKDGHVYPFYRRIRNQWDKIKAKADGQDVEFDPPEKEK